MPRKKSDALDFEKSLDKLNQLVEKMESGDLPLETSLKYFEEGVALVRVCQKALSNAEQKVQVLTENSEKLKPYTPHKDDDQ